MQYPEFIEKEEVISIHGELIKQHGGAPGIRDEGLLDSALYQPQATFGAQFLHTTIFAQAAAYLFHIVNNHAFVDGNKRTGFAAMVTFLNKNDYQLAMSQKEAYELTIQVAEHKVNKEELTAILKNYVTQLF